jgi:predicted ATPase
MKIEICNLGVIKKTEIDLKPLTVFVGRNGEGKTWTAYALAAIFSYYGFTKYAESYFDGKTQEKYPPIDRAIEQLLEDGNAQINIVDFANQYAEIYINAVSKLASSWMNSFMATERANLKDLEIKISLTEVKKKIIEKVKAAFIKEGISPNARGSFLLDAHKEANTQILYFYSGDKIDIKLPRDVKKEFIIKISLQFLHDAFYKYVHTFPTERTAFITIPFGTNQVAVEKSSEDSDLIQTRLIKPHSSFLRMVASTYQINESSREKEIESNPKLQEYVDLANFLEKNILRGDLRFEESSLQKELLFQSTGVNLEMPIVASMIKELAPLVLLLRYCVQPNELLIIDEPEMNLHPAAQVEIIEFLAMLVNAGLNVLITTHSPYIVDHLANLMQAAKHDNKESIKELFYLERTDSFIAQENVSVYLFEDGTAKSILSAEGIIDWGTFGDVSNDISSIYSKLLKVN